MPPEFYPPELTQLSERTLGEVLAVVPEAILIGGWASHFRAGHPGATTSTSSFSLMSWTCWLPAGR
jgi:hypothetical protein